MDYVGAVLRVWLLLGLVSAASGSPPQDLLKTKFVTEVPTCRGWGAWETPMIFANDAAEAAHFLNGVITIPPRSIAVHPGPDRDVAVGWQSPVTGKVGVRAKVAHGHPSGGDGVTWSVLHESRAARKILAHGAIDRGGSQSIPAPADAEQLSAVAVQKGDGLTLRIGRRENHYCDTTIVELVIAVAAGGSRISAR